jgi:hypothetical protein
MYYFVKSELPREKVDEFTNELACGQIRGVEGNIAYVTPDGVVGYDIVECRDENDCLQKYSHLTQHGLRIDEITPVEPMSEFLKDHPCKR